MRLAFSAGGFLLTVSCAFGAGAVGPTPQTLLNLGGSRSDPFASSARARVFLFVRTDCPITNRYAPELQRLAREFEGRGAEFWLVYPDPGQTIRGIEEQIAQYSLPGKALRDPGHQLVKRARASVAPE